MLVQYREVANDWTYAHAVTAAPSAPSSSAVGHCNLPCQWEVHPFCGLLHTPDSNCEICSGLLLHIRSTKKLADENSLDQDEAKSFAAALAALHRQKDVSYWEGVERGRQEARREEDRGSKTQMPPPPEDASELNVSHLATEKSPTLQVGGQLETQLSSNVRPREGVPTKPSPPQARPHSGRKYQVPRDYYSVFRRPNVEAYLRDVMEKAQSDDVFALNHIKALAREAHSTPRDEKSHGQKIVLAEWRNPAASPHHRVEGPVLPNPRLEDPFEDWFTYYCVHGSSLPRGVRRDVTGKPYRPDLRASRLYAQLRPASLTTPATARTDFTLCSMEAILTDSYETILSKLSIRVASELRPCPYDGPAKVTVEEVARHFARCGITVEMVKRDIAPWAKEYQSPR